MNVMRRILEYYFLQICGYSGTNLRKDILEENKDKFIHQLDDGSEDTSQYQLASTPLSYIAGNQDKAIDDGLNYVVGSMDAVMSRNTFRIIFELMGQSQHYDMMMNEKIIIEALPVCVGDF